MKESHKLVSATEMKNRFGDYLGEVTRLRKPVLVERHGKPTAVLVSFEEWKRLNEERGSKTHSWSQAVAAFAEKLAKNHPNAKPFSAVDLIHETREAEEG